MTPLERNFHRFAIGVQLGGLAVFAYAYSLAPSGIWVFFMGWNIWFGALSLRALRGKGSLLKWKARQPWGGASIGDRRFVMKLLVLPKRIGDEWRWLGWEMVIQEHTRWETFDPDFGDITVRGWRDVAWADK